MMAKARNSGQIYNFGNRFLKYLFLLFIFTVYGFSTNTPNKACNEKFSESQLTIHKQNLEIKNLESKIAELKTEFEKLKDTQDSYRIEKNDYDAKMKANSELINAQDKRIGDLNFYFVAWGILITLILLIVFWKSNREAVQSAKDTIEKWIKSDAQNELNKIIEKELENNILPQLKSKIDEAEALLKSKIDKSEALLADIKRAKESASEHADTMSKLIEEYNKIPKEEFKRIEEKDENTLTSEELYKLALKSYQNNNFNTALNYFEKALKRAKENSNDLKLALFGKALTLQDLKKYSESIKTYQKLIEIDPNYDGTYNNLGNIYGDIKAFDKALDAYLKAIEINPQNDQAYYNMGIAYRNKKEYDHAIEAYRKAIEINPQKDDAYNNMGIAYANKKEYDHAIEAYRKAIEINPQNDQAYYNMGNAYYKLGKFDEVIEAYTHALKINPNKSSAYTNLFELQLTQNQPFALEEPYRERFEDQKESFIHYEMLKILQDLVNGKAADTAAWQQKYQGVSLGGWSFDELDAWVEGMEESKIKIRLVEALGVFKGHG